MSRRSGLVISLAALALLLAPLAALAAQPAAPRAKQPGITVEFKNTPILAAIEQLSQLGALSYVTVGDLATDATITAKFVNEEPVNVAGAVHYAIQHIPGIGCYVEGRAEVLILVPAPEEGVCPLCGHGRGDPVKSGGPGAAPQEPGPPSLNFREPLPLVDLDAQDAPLQEVAAQLSAHLSQAPSRVSLVVDDSVPRDIRVTAKVRRMSFDWVLTNLVNQADLTYTVEGVGMAIPPTGPVSFERHVIHIVPKPVLRLIRPQSPGLAPS